MNKKLIDLKENINGTLKRNLYSLFGNIIDKTFAIDSLNNLYHRILEQNNNNFFQACLDSLHVNYNILNEDFNKIPASGPVLVVSNHPFGGIEGIILGHLMLERRKDTKILGNYLLQLIPEIKEHIIAVDPFYNKGSIAANGRAISRCIRWLQEDGLLVTFPAGTVSHLNLIRREITDPVWHSHIAAIVRKSKATVIPVFFPGRNRFLFQVIGLIHPLLRTMLLPHELVNKSSKSIDVFIGNPVPWSKLKNFENDKQIIGFIRSKTYFLNNRSHKPVVKSRQSVPLQKDIIAKIDRSLLLKDLNSLDAANGKLVDNSEYSVYIAAAEQIPNILLEIGRLREVTFRTVQEGTGLEVDLDEFDQHYQHLFLWNKVKNELVGAYRIGLTDQLVEKFGPNGLYTNTLFHFKNGLLKHLQNALELGRSFIRQEYQRQYNCLALLWKGIGEFLIKSHKYHILFGPVSISKDYHNISRLLMIYFLKRNRYDKKLSRLVKPRNPFKLKGKRKFKRKFPYRQIRDIEDVSLFISEIEKDGKGIPILLRQYLKLNARLLSFNVDQNFSDVVDGLIMVNLVGTDPKILKRFMGSEGFLQFAKTHRIASPSMLPTGTVRPASATL